MRLPTRVITHPIITAILVLAFAGVAMAAVPVFNATEAPPFCTSCHEMQPYYDAWNVGAHKGVSCVECHVDAGAVNHLTHKVTAAQEVWVHVTGDPRFPQGTADVPDARCLRCHPDILSAEGRKFSHAKHAGAGPCVQCHSDAGHTVTLAALAQADVLRPGLAPSGAPVALAAITRPATDEAPKHEPVSCAKCHDLTKVACASCHSPEHTDRGACVTCHRPGPRWSFSHPAAGECVSCHEAPARHFSDECASCHAPGTAFADTAYDHTSKACASCHDAPSKHRSGTCTSCHKKPGASWAFTHPGSGSCASCHKAPSGHNRAVSCSACHRKAGASWSARHPASTACSSCHKAPSGHFGRSCSSCHKPMVSWSRATFSHPRTREHSYRSFACAKCHPSGYASASCTCHGGKPPKDDDD